MNKTIKEQAGAYCKEWSGGELETFVEHIITEERKRRLPTKEEFTSKCADFKDRDTSYFQDFKDIYDWLLSYESEAVVEDEVKGEDYQAKYNEAMVIIKRQAGDLQLLRENNIELKQELSHEKTLGNSARSDMEEAQKETEYWKERCRALDRRILEGSSVGIYSTIEPLNRNELAEKIMIASMNVEYREKTLTTKIIIASCFSLADEFIKQAKG